MSSSRYYTRFIPREEVGAVTRWEFGGVGGGDAFELLSVPPEAAPPEPPEPEAIDAAGHEALLGEARDEAYARGLAAGREQERLEWQQRMDDYVGGQGREVAERMARLAQAMESSFSGLQQAMAQEVLQLACDIARQVVRRETANPQAMLPVVREALSMLVGESRPATVRLHPADWAALEQPLREEFPAASRIQWQADATLQPGDCLVESAGMTVDGTLDKRWRRAIAALGLAEAWREGGHAG